MTDPQNRLESMLTKLKEHKFRVTPQRIAVLKILALSDGHPSVEQLFEQVKRDFPTTSLATVYKTVTLLKQLNEVLELGFTEGSNRYDGNRPYSHPHLRCMRPEIGMSNCQSHHISTGHDRNRRCAAALPVRSLPAFQACCCSSDKRIESQSYRQCI